MTLVIVDYQQLVKDIEDELRDVEPNAYNIIDIVMEAIDEVSKDDPEVE